MADLLRTDYKDDILNTDVNTQRKYRMVQNDDGTVSFEDVTEYEQIGDSFSAADINKTNLAIDALNNALENIHSTYSITHVIDGTLDYIKNGKERILVCNGCTLNDVNAVDISDSIPKSLSRNSIYSQYNNGLVNALVWYDTANNKFEGNYRASYGSSSPSSLSGTGILNGQIRWFVK